MNRDVILEMLNKAVEYSKPLKSEYVLIENGSVIGTDSMNCILKVTDCPTDIDYLSFNMKDITDLLKKIRPTDDIIMYNNRIIVKDGHVIVDSIQINNFIIDNVIKEKLKKMFYRDFNYSVINFNENEEFMEATTHKVAQGMSTICININNVNFFISVYGNLLPLNKGDKIIGRMSYRIGDPIYVMRYEINKKKGKVIQVYVAYLML